MRNSWLWFLLASCPLLLLMACQDDESQIADHLSRGDAYLEDGKFAEAIIEFRIVLQTDPNDKEAHWGLAQAYLEDKRIREAFWELRETSRLDPENLDARFQFGNLSIFAGDPEEALRQAEGMIERDPQMIMAYMLKGRALDAIGRPHEALEVYEAAHEIDPNQVRPLHHIAQYHRVRGDRESAEAVYRRIVEVEPTSFSHSEFASFLARDRLRDDEAEKAYREALKVANPKELPIATKLLASFLSSRDRLDEAIEVVERGIESVEDPLSLTYLLALIHRIRGNTARADEIIAEASAARPDDPRPHVYLSNHLAAQGDLDGALAAVREAVRVSPENQDARVRQADLLIQVGLRDEDDDYVAQGRGIVDAILAETPSDPGALLVKAKIALADDRADEAIRLLRSAIDAEPTSAAPHLTLGIALAARGEDTVARSELARALELDAGLLQARKALIRVHLRLGEYEYGVEEGRRYLRAVPGDVDARVVVAQGLAFLGNTEAALDELELIPEEDQDPGVLLALGKVHLRLGHRDVARDFLLRSYEGNLGNAVILRALMNLELREGLADHSAARIQKAVDADPENSELRLLEGIFNVRQNRGDAAEASLRRAIALDPTEFRAFHQLARYYGRVGRTPEMIQTYERAITTVPDEGRLHFFLGLLYEAENQRDRAIERYEGAIRLSPELSEAKNNLAALLADSGENLDRALDLAQEAKAQMPESPHAADTLGWVLYKRGVPSAAISYLKESEAGHDPTSTDIGIARYHLAKAYEVAGDPDNARAALERALDGLEERRQSLKARGAAEEADPEWAAKARTMLATVEG